MYDAPPLPPNNLLTISCSFHTSEWYMHPDLVDWISAGAGVNAAYIVGARNGNYVDAKQPRPAELYPNVFR